MTCTAIGSARRLSPRTASAADRTELRGVRGRDLSWMRDRPGQEPGPIGSRNAVSRVSRSERPHEARSRNKG